MGRIEPVAIVVFVLERNDHPVGGRHHRVGGTVHRPGRTGIARQMGSRRGKQQCGGVVERRDEVRHVEKGGVSGSIARPLPGHGEVGILRSSGMAARSTEYRARSRSVGCSRPTLTYGNQPT